MQEPGIDRHEWEGELSALEEQLADSPVEALPELDALVARMLEEAEIDEGEAVAEFEAAHEITLALERGSEEISAGDIGAAINGYRSVIDYIRSSFAT